MLQSIIAFCALLAALIALGRALIDHLRLKSRTGELNRQIEDLQRVLSHRGKLANEIAHEIKNPITAILCSAETLDLLIGDHLSPEHRKSLHYIKEYGDSLLHLVSDFLDISRAESGDISCNPRPVKLADTIDSVLGLLAPSAARKEISLRQSSEAPDLSAMADPIHLKQIVFNLLHNAIKFTEKGGEIHVNIKSDFPKPFIRIQIRDNGRGIPEPKLASLFDPYRRYDPHMSGAFYGHGPGAGLGLALCKSLVELSGGTISAESRVGTGTSFEFSLPVVPEAQADNTPQKTDGPQEVVCDRPLIGQTFILADKDDGSRDSVCRLIEAWGGVVEQVNEASSALGLIASGQYDAIMIDDSVLEGESSELIKSLKDEAAAKKTTLILTGNSDSRAEPEGRKIAKPFSGKALLNSLISSGKFHITH